LAAASLGYTHKAESLVTSPSVYLTVEDSVVAEGKSGDTDTYARFKVRLSRALSFEIMLDYETEDWTAIGGQDYVPASEILFIEAGEVEREIEIRIIGNDLPGVNQRSFLLNISPNKDVDILDGSAMGTIREDDLDLQRWSEIYNDPANLIKIVVDDKGNSYLLNGWQVFSIGPDGELHWSTAYTGKINDIILDRNGFLYVTGDDGHGNVFAAKLNADGSEVWITTFDSGEDNPDWGTLVTLDADGNVIILGGTEGDSDYTDQILLKVDPDGVLIWLQRLSLGEEVSEAAAGIGVDPDGNVYTTGVSGAGWASVVLLASYTKDGSYRWSMAYSSFGAPQNMIADMEYDIYGNAYLALSVSEPGQSRIATAKISSQGELVWQTLSLGVLGGYDTIYDLLLDLQGGFYLAMQVDNQTRIARYKENGSQEWITFLKDIYYLPNRLALDVDGNIFCTGGSLGSAFVTILFNRSNGERLWEQVFNDGGVLATSGYYGREVVVGLDGTIYVAGNYIGQLAMITYDPIPQPALVRVVDNSVQETISEKLEARIQLHPTIAFDEDVQVGFETVDGTALAGQDYQAISGTLTIPAHQLTASLGVTILNDAIQEPRERFYLRFFPVSENAALIDSLGIIEIWDASDKQIRLPVVLR